MINRKRNRKKQVGGLASLLPDLQQNILRRRNFFLFDYLNKILRIQARLRVIDVLTVTIAKNDSKAC